MHVGRERLRGLVPSAAASGHIVDDTFLAHPLYGFQGWVCVVNPAARTTDAVLDLLRDAHDAARRRYERRRGLA